MSTTNSNLNQIMEYDWAPIAAEIDREFVMIMSALSAFMLFENGTDMINSKMIVDASTTLRSWFNYTSRANASQQSASIGGSRAVGDALGGHGLELAWEDWGSNKRVLLPSDPNATKIGDFLIKALSNNRRAYEFAVLEYGLPWLQTVVKGLKIPKKSNLFNKENRAKLWDKLN